VELDKAPGYWPTRIMLAVAFAVVGFELLLAPAFLWEPMFDSRVSLFGVPQGVVVFFTCVGMSLAGLARMVRVYRGPRDEPPPWRYRDR
jgi:hypothetical protein